MQIGEMLVKEGLVTEDQLKEAVAIQNNNPNKMIGEILIELDYIDIDKFVKVLERQLNEKTLYNLLD